MTCDTADSVCVCQKAWSVCDGACVDLDGDAAHCGACAVTCTGGGVCDHGVCAASVTPSPAPRTAVGAACTGASTCAPGSSCVGGVCACDAGKVACNGACRDYQTDSHSCGACGFICLHASCSDGVCGAITLPPSFGFVSVTDVGPSATSSCDMETEAFPTRSLTTGDLFTPYTWSDGGSPEQVHFNATDGGSAGDAGLAWGTNDGLKVPAVSGNFAYADSWSGTDTAYVDAGGPGLELFMDIFEPLTDAGEYVGLAGTTMANLHSPASWDKPMVAVPDDASSPHYDGPAMVFDNSTGRLWVVANLVDDLSPRVWWTNSGCTAFPADCTIHWKELTQAAGVNNGSLKTGGHYTIALNPLTNGVMIAFHDQSDRIRLILLHLNMSGDLVLDSDLVVDTSAPHDPNTKCPLPDGGATTDCPNTAGDIEQINRSGGMGDYIGAARVGRANGDPFGAMPMPVVTSASCIPCQGSQYSLPMKGMDLVK
jgi:hypothetical protein